MERLANSRHELAGQAMRYGAAGGAVAALYAGIYWAAAVPADLPVQLANAIGFLVALVAGYALHSGWSFKGRGRRSLASSSGRYVAVNAVGYVLNCFWVWLIVGQLRHSVELSVLPIVTLTPALMFVLNRQWTFAGRT